MIKKNNVLLVGVGIVSILSIINFKIGFVVMSAIYITIISFILGFMLVYWDELKTK